MNDLAGLRMIWNDETQANSTLNETRLSKVTSGMTFDVEHKGIDYRPQVKSQAKITMNGNHNPNLVSGDNAGGLARRLMVLNLRREEYVISREKQQIDLETELLKEGPQIMT